MQTPFNLPSWALPSAMQPALTHEQKWNEAIDSANGQMLDYLSSTYRFRSDYGSMPNWAKEWSPQPRYVEG